MCYHSSVGRYSCSAMISATRWSSTESVSTVSSFPFRFPGCMARVLRAVSFYRQ